jgi:N6-L-threonylcarbamoyladenine synthase
VEATKALSFIYKKPFIPVNHMMGHICANNINQKLEYPLVSLVVSGGHTDLIYMENESAFTYLGSTLDDAIGECFDKVARILSMPYPGGPNVEKLALEGKSKYPMPDLLKDDNYSFSFSGIKSHVNNLVHNANQRGEEINKADLACSFQNAVTNALVGKTKKAIEKYKVKNFAMCGGVAANSFIRNNLKEMCDSLDVKMYVPEKNYCTYNAAMIGAAAYILYKNNKFTDLSLNAKPNIQIDFNDFK